MILRQGQGNFFKPTILTISSRAKIQDKDYDKLNLHMQEMMLTKQSSMLYAKQGR